MGEVEELENLNPLIEDVKSLLLIIAIENLEKTMLMMTSINFSLMKAILDLPIQLQKMVNTKYSMK